MKNADVEEPENPDNIAVDIRGMLLRFTFLLTKYFLFMYLIYLVHCLPWSILWLVGLATMLTLREEQNYRKRRARAVKMAAININVADAIAHKFAEMPSWVKFPDVDRAEWVNTIIKQLWPTLNTYLIKLLRAKVQKKIRKKFESFRFEELDFGCICPRVDGIKVYDNNTTRNEIIVDIDVFYDSTCDINFSIYGTKGNINDVQFSVELRIVLKPLIRKLPLIGGMQLFFLNTPDIDFNLEGIANIPGLAHFIKKHITKVLDKKIVFPNKIPIRFTKSVDGQELKCLEPEGVLRVHVAEAKDLEKRDMNVLGIGSSDPYAIISLGAQKFKTKIMNSTVDPKWDFWCEFCVLDPSVQHIDVEVLDHDIKSDDFFGKWITLERVKRGKIHLRFTWFTLSNDYKDLDAVISETELLQVRGLSTALLAVYVEPAKKLPQQSTHKKPNPYVALTLADCSYETKAKKHTTEPLWEQGFFFLTAHPETATLFVNIIDKTTDDKLDQFVYGVYNLVDKTNLFAEKTDYQMSNGSILSMSLNLRILKNDTTSSENSTDSSEEDGEFSRQGSTKSKKSDISNQNPSDVIDPVITKIIGEENDLVRRSSSKSTGKYGLGQIQITLHYSEPRQKIIVAVHKIANIPLKDASNVPDPYVKLLLLPGGPHKKHKTKVIVDDCNPVYDQTFEYLMSQHDLPAQKLVITVKSKVKMALHNRLLGHVVLHLRDFDLSQCNTSWFDLGPECKD